jgi:medium-chain acyl-[acyl-carrier-protein] hydrolase
MEVVPSREGEEVAKFLGVHCELTSQYVNFPQAVIAEAATAVAAGVAGRKPRPVRALAFTAGLANGIFANWKAMLPTASEVVAIDLPTALDKVKGGIAEIGQAIAASLVRSVKGKLDLPYALVGHGLGAWLAYEVLCALREAHVALGGSRAAEWRLPDVLLVSGIRPPHLHAAEHSADRETPKLSKLKSAAFWKAFEQRYGVDPNLEELKDYFEPNLKRELELLETYSPSSSTASEGDALLHVVACAAEGDRTLLPGQLDAWDAYAGEGAQRFQVHELEVMGAPKWAKPNRYLLDAPAAFQRVLGNELTALSYRSSTSQPKHEPQGAQSWASRARGRDMLEPGSG